MNTESIDVYYPQTIPDRIKEFEEYSTANAVNTHKKEIKDRTRKSEAKIARILASKEDKYYHAIKLIIEHAESAKVSESTQYADYGKTFSIPYDFFNFEDHPKARDLLESFLTKLKLAGCFIDYKRSPMTFSGFELIFSGVNLEALYKYKNILNSNLKLGKHIVTDSDIKVFEISEKSKKTNLKPPKGWKFVTNIKKPQILKDNHAVYEFPTNWANKYRYFLCLWQDFGVKKTYKELYEFNSELKYPEKDIWKTNRNIRNIIYKLRKEFDKTGIPIEIIADKGFTLSIQQNKLMSKSVKKI